MQVTDLSKLVYNGTVYGCKSKTTDGNVDTYHFSGDVHSGLADADLEDVVITVDALGATLRWATRCR